MQWLKSPHQPKGPRFDHFLKLSFFSTYEMDEKKSLGKKFQASCPMGPKFLRWELTYNFNQVPWGKMNFPQGERHLECLKFLGQKCKR